MSVRMAKRLSLALAVLVAGALFATKFVYPWIEPAAYSYDVLGVSISHEQGAIDWDRLHADEIDFAYIRASQGSTINDPRFSRNWYAARQAGILRGAYHEFSRCRTGEAQADNFLRVVPMDADALPPVVFASKMERCRETAPVADVAAEIAVFIDRIRPHYKRRPILYTTREFHDAYLTGKFATQRFWIRSLLVEPRYRTDQWIFWHYHNRGRRRGVDGPVDLSAFRGTLAELRALR